MHTTTTIPQNGAVSSYLNYRRNRCGVTAYNR